MKIKFIFSAAFIFCSFMVKAQVSIMNYDTKPVYYPSFDVSVLTSKIPAGFQLQVSNPLNKKLHLQISGRHQGVLIDTVINDENFARIYNMKEAEDGSYMISVRSGKEKVEKEVELTTISSRNLIIRD
ncbi:MAG: hypothetical protein SGI83_11660 [Bacteroidota bacterium]|nr:hypothetical protein [Bacteroidota bacterium]